MSLAKDELFAYDPLTISKDAIEAEFVDILLALVDMSLANEALFAYDPLTVSKDAIEAELVKILLAKEALPSTFDNSIYDEVKEIEDEIVPINSEPSPIKEPEKEPVNFELNPTASKIFIYYVFIKIFFKY